MEEKKYEPGKVEISSEEYRDLVREAVKEGERASRLSCENWKLEKEIKTLKEELALTRKALEEKNAIVRKLECYIEKIDPMSGLKLKED